MSTLTFGFIGLGLIGGSIARAIRQNLPQSQIIAYDINADTLREAAQCGVANVITTRIDASFSDCDYLFLCAPVQKNDENLSAVKEIVTVCDSPGFNSFVFSYPIRFAVDFSIPPLVYGGL